VTESALRPGHLPRLLAGLQASEPLGLSEHLNRVGPLPRLDSVDDRAELISEVERSGLRGRGGAGFPLAAKARAVAAGPRPRVVVVNGAEGEPASAKDDLLLAKAPHLVLDGAVLAASMVDADDVIVCAKHHRDGGLDAIAAAVAERAGTSADPAEIRVVEVSSGYLIGEESALVHLLNGGPAKPTFVPPRPFERGVADRPTLIQNVETLANLALIARLGAAWFREVGPPEDPGSVLITLSGPVAKPGVYEIAAGTPLGELVRAAGGATVPIQAFLVGGYSGSWFPVETAAKLKLSRAALHAAGGTLGPGVVVALPEGACGLSESARLVRYLAEESAGQCGPCVHGLAAIAAALEEMSAGVAPPGTHEWVAYWGADVLGRGACHHPDGAVRLVSSCLEVFAEEIERHEEGRPCAPTLTEVLPLGGWLSGAPEPA
jgi:NADH:ubiquinone oxidoreductase subunit F (NADH-binding)